MSTTKFKQNVFKIPNKSIPESTKQADAVDCLSVKNANQTTSSSNSLKSSVKRLFSPKHSHNSSLSPSPQILTTPSGNSGSVIGTPVMTSKRPVQQPQTQPTRQNSLTSRSASSVSTNPATEQINTICVSLSADLDLSSSKTDELQSLSAQNDNYQISDITSSSNTSTLSSSTTNSTTKSFNNKATRPSVHFSSASKPKPVIASSVGLNSKTVVATQSTGSAIKKHLNLLKSNSKKVLMGSSASPASLPARGVNTRLVKTPSTQLASNINRSSSQSQSSSPVSIEYESKINELANEIKNSELIKQELENKLKDLQSEMERLSRLYDFEMGQKSRNEENLQNMKKIAEEKQCESAAIKFEYRKIQELKENLLNENSYLKSLLLNHQKQLVDSCTSASPALSIRSNHSTQTTPLYSSQQTINQSSTEAYQQASSRNSHLLQKLNNNNGNINRSLSPSTNILSQSPQSSPLAQHQHQQLQSTPNSTISRQQYQLNAAQQAVYQQKYNDLEQQFRSQLEQLKELKDTVNNLNEMNRKLYDENQQFKDRNLDQRQQIDNFHMLFKDNKQEAERQVAMLRREFDETLKREAELKKRLQQVQDMKQQEMSELKQKLDQSKQAESRMISEIGKTKFEFEQLEKKCKSIEKDNYGLKEHSDKLKADLDSKIESLKCQLDCLNKQTQSDRLKQEERTTRDNTEHKKQLDELEHKLEEVIKEKAQITCKYAQVVDNNRELNKIIKNNDEFHDKELDDTKNKLEFYMNKCNELEKEISECQENHTRDQEEWKKFQADLQTAVRVANDFMNEAEEKCLKTREDYVKSNDECEKLKKRLQTYESGHKHGFMKQKSKENLDAQLSPSTASNSSSIVRNLIDSIESSATTTLNQNTDTDDAKLLSSSFQNRTNSSASSEALANLVKQYGVSKRNALMKWCQERLYLYKGIEIKNFSSSWNDGLAFCALMHSFMPNKIDFEQHRVDCNPKKNFLTAFKLAESVGIEQTLNVHDLLNQERPDWNAVMNYVALIYKHFQKTDKIEDDGSKPFVAAGRSSSESPPKNSLRNTGNIPLSLSTSSSSSSGSSAFNSASSSSSSISKTNL